MAFLARKGLVPSPEREGGSHRPLDQRKGGSSYEEKVEGMSGKRRERYERNRGKMQGMEDNVSFYKEKQALG